MLARPDVADALAGEKSSMASQIDPVPVPTSGRPAAGSASQPPRPPEPSAPSPPAPPKPPAPPASSAPPKSPRRAIPAAAAPDDTGTEQDSGFLSTAAVRQAPAWAISMLVHVVVLLSMVIYLMLYLVRMIAYLMKPFLAMKDIKI